MSYCPEHGYVMNCLNPDAYDGVLYQCPDGGEAWVWADGCYTPFSNVADAQAEFGIALDTDSPTL